MEIKAFAKINLCIDVLGRRPDGYHEVSMVMQLIDLWDRVTVETEAAGNGLAEMAGRPSENGTAGPVRLSCSRAELPADESNLAWKAAALLMGEYPQAGGEAGAAVRIHIEKNIPMAAGLGGGSADAAAVLHGLNQLWQLGLSINELMALGVRLGADVPFCLMGQAALHPEWGFPPEEVSVCALAAGIGEKLTPLPSVRPVAPWVLLSKPPVSVSTAAVYQGLRPDGITSHPDPAELAEGIKTKKIGIIAKNMQNILEIVSLKEYPEIVYTKDKMDMLKSFPRTKDSFALMSGSGPTVFRLFAEEGQARAGLEEMKRVNEESFAVAVV